MRPAACHGSAAGPRQLGETVTPALRTRPAGKEGAMFDGVLVDFTGRRSDESLAASTLPWQFVALLFCFATLTIVAAILYPDMFGAPFEQF